MLLRDREDPAGAQGRRGGEAKGLAREGALTEEVLGPQHTEDGLFPVRGHHRELHAPALNVEDPVGLLALRKHDSRWRILPHGRRHAWGGEEHLGIEFRLAPTCHGGLGTHLYGARYRAPKFVLHALLNCTPGRAISRKCTLLRALWGFARDAPLDDRQDVILLHDE